MELLIAVNPNPESRLRYLLRLPLGGGQVFATSDVWPRTKALYCHPLPAGDWPADPELIETVELRSCTRRGAAIDVVAARARENRSQLVFTTARGRDVVFWQSPRTAKQSRPGVRTPTARAAGLAGLDVVVDTRERYGYTFAGMPVSITRAALQCGDYGLTIEGRLVAAVERKSLADLTAGLLNGKLKYQLTELTTLPRAAVVVEDRFSEVFTLTHAKPAAVADALAELQIAFPTVPIVFCQTRKLAQEYTYRYLAAAHNWAVDAGYAATTLGADESIAAAPARPEPRTADVRAWALATGLAVSDRGRLRPEIMQAWRDAHQ
ncbi:Lsr2 family protein [Mycobacterium sp. M1]|uniref:Lsr2 family protein n=1 Tax=Mycolicibacter acidiphilus TaxID=2835306 RepID=A0ABS5RDC6_9MYCO|nr:ERCC4 domain-containing protein [Mycolicibacter acidiphilus]MBS9532169.1 Lsr2 family protein [Mycolicibacter acidiphilus]